MTDEHARPLDLVSTEALVRGHHDVEEALFTLLGAWSTDPASATGPSAAEIQMFFATQAALHAWRAEQWEQRRPRSVGPGDDDGAASGQLDAAWEHALGAARGQGDGPTRLACWAGALQPALAARYRAHERGLAPAADAGTARWLRISLGDVLAGLADGAELMIRGVPPDRADPAAVAVSDALLPLLAGSPR